MWLKKKKINILEQSIEKLSHTLEEGNYIEWAHLLGNKKEIIKRNLLARNSKGSRNWNRCYHHYGYFSDFATKDCDVKYSCDRRVYC